jgi:penicillin-binding protein 1A
LFKPQQGQNWGAGSILVDQDIKSWNGGIDVQNYDGRFKGPMTIRQAIGQSRNPPAVQAAKFGNLESAIQTTKDAGNRFYCNDIQYGTTAASGRCAVTEVQHTNAYATLARQGTYKPEAYVLEVKNGQGQMLTQWKDDQSKKVLDPQITYMLSDILADDGARAPVFGARAAGFNVPGVKTATKTGTTDDGKGHAKDSWMMSYSPRMAIGVWTGRNDTKPLSSLSSVANARVTNVVQEFAHKEIFAKDGSWKANDWFTKPSGIQTLTVNGKTDIFPSWYTKPTNADGETIAFDKVSKKKATDFTPAAAKVEVKVPVFEDPVTKKKMYTAPDGYQPDATDDVHNCSDVKPFASVSVTGVTKSVTINVTVNQGTHPLSSVTVSVDGQQIANQPVGGTTTITIPHTFSSSGNHTVTATVYDTALYDGTASTTKTVAATNNTPSLPTNRRRGDG